MASSPFASSSSRPGFGTVHLIMLSPSTPTFSTLNYTYPLKLLSSTPHLLQPLIPKLPLDTAESLTIPNSTPTARRPASVPLLFLLSYGGGLLPPDTISLTVTLASSTRLTITTQGTTKIFPAPSHSPFATAEQTLLATLGPHSALWLAPDPVQPFRNSRYVQTQIFELAEGASLGIIDWISEGRRARGESWMGNEWRTKNEVWRISEGQGERKLLLRDTMVLNGEAEGEVARRMEGLGTFGTLVMMGPILQPLAALFVDEFAALPRVGGREWGDEVRADGVKETWRRERWKSEKDDGVVWTAARARGLVLVKFGAREVDGAKRWLGIMLRETGTVGREFGEGGLMCVR